mmetsp:Transcript_78897/g.150136  ORF Transcript_78897/g.150136 Transcript_78897/m.150136 type:complete len:302 (+) Transcript_78897:118-1023(+)
MAQAAQWELKLKERDQRIAQLEMLVVEQESKIRRLEATHGGGGGGNADELQEEVQQLRAIVEAQEEAIREQGSIIATQSGLLDELNGHLSRQTDAPSSAPIAESPLEEEDDDDDVVVTPTSSAPPAPVAGSRAAGGSASMSSLRVPPSAAGSHAQGAGMRGSRTSAAGSEPSGGRRRREGVGGMGQRQAATHPGTHPTGNAASMLHNARDHREQLLAQKLLKRHGNSSTTAVEHPRAPRPNSALGRGSGATPRARSWTERSGNNHYSARGPSPTRGTEAQLHSKKSGGPLPPALPLLRQEA